jgi:type IV pilus assembly protein PilW
MNAHPNPTPAAGPSGRAAKAQSGFTLVELLVAIALGLLVMIALVAVYTNVSRTNSEMSKTNSMIEGGRFTIDVLNEDITHAGFWGGYTPMFDSLASRVVPTGVPGTPSYANGPCHPYINWNDATNAIHREYHDYLTGVPVESYRDAEPPGCPTSLIADRKAGTDVLVVRHAETCVPGANNCEALDTNKVYFQPSFCASEIDGTAYAPTSPRPYVLSNGTATFTLRTRTCSTPASATDTLTPIRKFVSNIYYVRTYAVTAGDGVPTLVRSSFGATGGTPVHQPAQALIEGVEAFAVEMGVDTGGRCGSVVNYGAAISLAPLASGGNLVDPADCLFKPDPNLPLNTLPLVRGDGVPDTWVRCPAAGCAVDQLRDTVALKLFVLARSKDPSVGHTDTKTYQLGSGITDTLTITPAGTDQQYKRHAFHTTIRFVNVAGRRETP